MAEEPAEKKTTTWKGVLLRVLVALLALSAVFFGLRYYLHTRIWAATDDAFIEGHVIAISPKVSGYVEELKVDDNQQVAKGEILLKIDSRDYQVRLDQAKANLVAALANQSAAQTNVELTRVTSNASLDQARAAVRSAKSAVETAAEAVETASFQEKQRKAQAEALQASREEAQANIAAAEAEAIRTELDWKRYKDLRGTPAVTEQQLDNAEAAANAAKAKLEAAQKAMLAAEAQVLAGKADVEVSTESVKQSKSRLAQAQAQQAEAEAVAAGADIVLPKLAVSQSQLKTADATIEQLKAAVAQAELDLSYTVISAPEAGRVTRRTVERGAFVQPGEELFAVVPNPVWVIANYKETELTYIHKGQEVVIEVDTYPGKYLRGKVDSIQSGTGARFSLLPPENATGNYVKVVQRVPVKIVFDGEPWNNEQLAPGLSVEAEVKIR